LPIQSGDDEILRKMNRGYTVKYYKNLIKKIRQKIPNVLISTDVIVGFPGETKAQFENTVKLFKEIGFSKAYIAKYSPRYGTAAAKLKDSVFPQEKKRRWRILEEIVKQGIIKKAPLGGNRVLLGEFCKWRRRSPSGGKGLVVCLKELKNYL
jgi:tRNA A37 methylthiotransferase MiaB